MNIVNKQLVQLANESDLVKNYLDIPKEWKNITKITSNSVHKYIGDGLYKAKFVGNRKYKGFITTNQYIRLIEEGAFDFSIEALLELYAKEKKVDAKLLLKGLELIK